MSDQKQRFTQVLDLSREILRIQDLDVLLERVLTYARKFANADAGSLYLKEEDTLKFSYTQNETLQGKLPPGKKLVYSTFTMPIDHTSIAGYVASTGKMLNIDDAYEIPSDRPYRFGKKFDEASGYRTRSILTFPIMNHRSEVLGVLQLINAKDASGGVVSFDPSDEPFINHFADNAALAIERAQMTRAIILRMISMAELRDPKETGPHVNRVASYAVEIYEEWARLKGLPHEDVERDVDILRMASMLHDAGKIAIPDAILKKPARLDDDEVAIMRQHTWLGARLFKDRYSDFDEASLLVALNHHEKWDGTGYPGHVDVNNGKPLHGYETPEGKARGKKAEEIHPFGRVVAIADVYDALSSRRSYKEAWTEDKVIDTLKHDAGTHFDPEMIQAFVNTIDVLRSIASRYPDEGH